MISRITKTVKTHAFPVYIFLVALLLPSLATAVINMRMQTDLGSFDIELFDTVAPLTVANFMNYVNDGDYDGTFFHRSEPGFVVQGGGFIYEGPENFFTGGASHIPTDPAVVNEFNLSNLRGTIAMAKIPAEFDEDNNLIPGTGPDSATSEWFFNVEDNSGVPPDGLDYQNGGFTVFAQVLGNGMDVVDAIAALPRCIDVVPFPQFCGTFTEVPFTGSAADDLTNDGLINISCIGTDNDGDGALDNREDAAPNSGDGNNDTILDSTQQQVASFSDESGEYIVIEAQAVSPLRSLDVLGTTFALVNPDSTGILIDREFIHGYFGFAITNALPGDNTVLVTLPAGALPGTYYNYGPTPGDANPHWYDFTYDGVTGAELNGNLITLHYADGLRGDADLLQDGTITAARGGPANVIGDGDGISDLIEDGAPNNGDGNNDGAPDKQQPNVASLVDVINGNYVTIAAGATFLLQNVGVADGSNILLESGSAINLSGLNFTHGFLGYEVKNLDPGGEATIKIYLPDGESPVKYYKFGPTPDNPVDHLYEFNFDGETGAEFSGNEVILHFVDGKRGDSDLTANGVIVDPGTPAIKARITSASSGGGSGCSINGNRSATERVGSWLLIAICVFCLGIYRKRHR